LNKIIFLQKELCYDSHRCFVYLFDLHLSGGEEMAIIATVASVGTVILATGFALWMVSQLFSKN